MRVLLDENLHRKLKLSFDQTFEVLTVTERGWGGRQNGDMLRAAQSEFDAFVTMDKGIADQQNLSSLDLAIVVLHVPSNRYQDTEPLMPEVCAVLKTLGSGQLATVTAGTVAAGEGSGRHRAAGAAAQSAASTR